MTTYPLTRTVGRPRERIIFSRNTTGLFFCLPLLVLLLGVVCYPAVYSIYLSMLSPELDRFVWLDNYLYLLETPTFRSVIFQTCLFAFTSVLLMSTFGFLLAVAMNSIRSRGLQRLLRSIILIPWVIPLSISTLTWWWLLDPSYSAVNWLIKDWGFSPINFLGDTTNARIATISVRVWQGTPFFMIMYMAALKGIPQHLYEAADIDGANMLQKTWYVTLPTISGTIMITMLFGLMTTFAEFDIVQVLTAGGPQDSTHVFATYAFRVGLGSGDIPLGAANSLFMVPFLSVVAFFVLRNVAKKRMEAL